MKKLINWKECQLGIAVCNTETGLFSDFIGVIDEYRSLTWCRKTNDYFEIATKNLTVAKSELQPWLLYTGLIPMWGECEYKITATADFGECAYLQEVKTLPSFVSDTYKQYEIAQYKIVGIKSDWTYSQ